MPRNRRPEKPTAYGIERRDYHDTYGGNAMNAGPGIGGFGGGIGGGLGGGHFGLGRRGMSPAPSGAGTGHRFGKPPKGYKRSDERILEDVCECIMRRPDLDASEVEVRVSGGVVMLSGLMHSRADKRAIEDLADDVLCVEDVRNDIQIGRPDPVRRVRSERGRARS